MQRSDSFILDADWEDIRQKYGMKKVESFTLLEELPEKEPPHIDERIQNAVSPAMLVVGKDGKEYLIGHRN